MTTSFTRAISILMTPPLHASFNEVRNQHAKLIKISEKKELLDIVQLFVEGFFLALRYLVGAIIALAQNTILALRDLCICKIDYALNDCIHGLSSMQYYLRAGVALPFILFTRLYSQELFSSCMTPIKLGNQNFTGAGNRLGADEASMLIQKLQIELAETKDRVSKAVKRAETFQQYYTDRQAAIESNNAYIASLERDQRKALEKRDSDHKTELARLVQEFASKEELLKTIMNRAQALAARNHQGDVRPIISQAEIKQYFS